MFNESNFHSHLGYMGKKYFFFLYIHCIFSVCLQSHLMLRDYVAQDDGHAKLLNLVKGLNTPIGIWRRNLY